MASTPNWDAETDEKKKAKSNITGSTENMAMTQGPHSLGAASPRDNGTSPMTQGPYSLGAITPKGEYTNTGADSGTTTEDQVSKLYQAALQNVRNTYQQQRNTLNEQQASLPYQYQQQRNQVSSQAAQSARALNEAAAQRGLYNSGSARTDLARNQAARDSGINNLNYQQQQAANQLTNRLNELNAAEATAITGLQGQEAQDARNYALQLANLTGTYNGQDTLAAQQLALQKALQEANLTGTYNGQETLAAQQFRNQLAAAIMAAYAEGTDQFTLPSSVTTTINNLFGGGSGVYGSGNLGQISANGGQQLSSSQWYQLMQLLNGY